MQIGYFLLMSVSLAWAADREITLCDFADGRALEGKDVSIRGKIAFTAHGMAFMGESCKYSPPGVAVILPNSGAEPKVDFKLDQQSLQQLVPFFRLTGGSAI